MELSYLSLKLFFMSPGFMRDQTGDFTNKSYFSNAIASLKQ